MLTTSVTLSTCLVTVVVSGHGELVTNSVGMVFVLVHRDSELVSKGKVFVSVHVLRLKVGMVVLTVEQMTVVVVRSKGTDFVAM